MRHWSLTRTLIAAFVCLGALPAAVLGWRLVATTSAMSGALDNALSRERDRSLHQNLNTVALSLSDRLDRALLERYDDAQACGVNTALLYRRAWYRVGNGRNRIVRAANRYVKLYGVYSLAMMVDLNGRVIAVNDRDANGKALDTAPLYDKQFATASWFQEAKAGRFFTGGGDRAGARTVATLTGGGLAGNSLTGTVVHDIYVDDDVKKICGGDGRTLGFSAPVYDGKGHVVGIWNNRANFSGVEALLASAAHDLALPGVSGVKLTLIDREGRVLAGDIHAGYGPARSNVRAPERRGLLGWGVLARVDDAEAADVHASDAVPAGDARAEVLGVLATSVLLLGLGAWWLGRSITRPVIGGIARLRDNASQVSAVSMEVADASQALSIGASDQAAAIEASSASMEEMSAMTRQNATHAEEAASLMGGARDLVEGANVALGGMVDSMGAIQQATTGISKIIKTIDELAFQSNLLALNAAIEAARAGTAGAGFGVVADEVRSLAQRSAQAAKDTSALIEASIARAGDGSRRVDEVVQAMAAITERLERLHELLQQVKQASGQQTQGIDQVTHALTRMGQATQSTAAAAEESAATSQELTAVARSALTIIANLERVINGVAPALPSAQTQKSGSTGKRSSTWDGTQAKPARVGTSGSRRGTTRAA